MLLCKSKLLLRYPSNFRIFRKFSSDFVGQWSCPEGYPTEISIYSTLTKQLEPFNLKDKGIIKWYTCGPTVYDKAHIGHACCYMKFDIIRRILENFFNFKVFYVMGITDIDDKIIIRANVLKKNFTALAKGYEIDFFSDLAKLNILPPNTITRVSDHIPEIVEFVDKLMKKGLAYSAPDGSVYFNTQKYGNYGKFYQTLEENVSESNSPHKKHPLDFAVWKGVKPNEPFWETSWGKGRPGWHIECSVMASKYFDSQVDIHSGGIDLFFPHHEDEEAQCCAYHDVSQWVNYWIHSGHLFLKNNVKMSKSLQNTVDVDQFLEKYAANDFRFLCLLSRYRHNLEYDSDMMKKAVALRKKFGTFLENAYDYIRTFRDQGNVDEVQLLEMLHETEKKVRSSLANDFNTVVAVAQLANLVTLTNSMIWAENSEATVKKGSIAVAYVADYVKKTLTLLGVDYQPDQVSNNSIRLTEEVISASVEFRSQIRNVAVEAIKQKEVLEPKDQFKSLLQICDQFRDKLSTTGIVIKDHKDKSAWSFDTENKS